VTVRARFDDHGAGTSFELSEPVSVFIAQRPDEVLPALRAAEHAAVEGNWVGGFVSYEAAPGLDPLLPARHWPSGHPLTGLPLAWFASYARHRVINDDPPVAAAREHAPGPGWRLDRDAGWHARAVASAQEAIAAGDYYQLNLTTRLVGAVPDPDALYGELASAQSGRYHALIETGDHTIVSASPELFFATEDDLVVTRPMKGTATRGRWSADDEQRAVALRADVKERAENVMITDLLRNDLSRVAEVGSVRVPELFVAERYPTVWQLTSSVTARLRAEIGLTELFAALFPSGSVTGAPKLAAMTAIGELEGRPRGVYCGAIGYLRPCAKPGSGRPSARFSVAIRTATVCGGYAEYGTGGGITASSRPDAEWAELLAKSQVLRRPEQPAELFETLRYEPPGALVNVEGHLARLSASARYWGFPGGELATARTSMLTACQGRGEPTRVRLALKRSGAVDVTVADMPAALDRPVRLAVADRPVHSGDALLFHKHGDRGRYDRFRRGGFDDVILWNERGEATEITIANLAVRLAGRWYTPPLESGLLPGVERARLIEAGELTERVIPVHELAGAEELAVINSLRGWRSAELAQPARVGGSW
jgi:para-aminobenzoate synthetase/4-amino-4-deoxychorismate lyase